MATNYNLKLNLISDDSKFSAGFRDANRRLKEHQLKVANTGVSYTSLSKTQRLTANYAREVGVALGAGSRKFREAAAEARRLQRELAKINNTKGLTGGAANGGLMGGVLGVAMKRILPLMVLATAGKLITSSVQNLANFEEKMSQVKAITDSTNATMDKFKEAAIRISSVTPKTATEVANLQVELSKLGFSAEETLVSIRSIIDLSVAGFFDLGQTATLTAQTLNAFSLSAGYTRDVADTFAYAISHSALTLEKLAVGLPNVAQGAKEFGWSIQKTTGLLGILADNGIDASKMGTDLRMIITILAKEGLTLDEALTKINGSTDKITTAQEMFGQRAYLTSLALASQSEDVKKLDAQYKNISGTAERMAAVMQDNVKGALLQVASAWEAFVQGLANDEGYIRRFFVNLAKSINWVNVAMGNLNQLNIDQFSSNLRKAAKDIENAFGDSKEGINAVLVDLKNQVSDLEKTHEEWFAGFSFGELEISDVKGKDKTRLRSLKEQMEALKTVIAEYEGKLNIPVNLRVNGGGSGSGSGDGEAEIKYLKNIGKEARIAGTELEKTKNLIAEIKLKVDIGTATDWEKEMLPVLKNAAISMQRELDTADPLQLTVKTQIVPSTGGIGDRTDVLDTKDLGMDFINDGTTALLESSIQGFIDASNSGDWSNFGATIKEGMANFLIDFGKMLIMQGILILAAEALSSNWVTAPAAIAVGAAAVGIGIAMRSKSSVGGGSSGGGGGSMPSFQANSGYSRYAGISGHNATGSSSRSLNDDSPVKFVVKGTDLVAVLNNNKIKSNNIH